MSAFALRNVPDIIKTLSEMKRVVKPGGRVVTLELAKLPFSVLNSYTMRILKKSCLYWVS